MSEAYEETGFDRVLDEMSGEYQGHDPALRRAARC